VIAIVDYGMGNRRSVENAFEHVGAEPVITSDHDLISRADHVVLPGVGAFPQAMRNIRRAGLDQVLSDRFRDGGPILGLCLGMQLLFERSVELSGDTGLGLLPGEVVALQPDPPTLKIPHIGWNVVAMTRESPLTEGLPDRCAFYHVHSFVARPAEASDVLGRGDYGGPFVSIVARDPIYGVQFHPEKSSTHGLALLANFTAICARTARATAVP
jgi:glutamine amidotransferase